MTISNTLPSSLLSQIQINFFVLSISYWTLFLHHYKSDLSKENTTSLHVSNHSQCWVPRILDTAPYLRLHNECTGTCRKAPRLSSSELLELLKGLIHPLHQKELWQIVQRGSVPTYTSTPQLSALQMSKGRL